MSGAEGRAAPRVGVVVVNYHNDQSAVRVARQAQLQARVDGCACKVVVVDNSRTIDAGLVDRATRWGICVVPLANSGYAGGVNEGVRRLARYGVDHVLVLSHEVQLGPGAVGVLIGVLEEDMTVAAVGPLLLDRTSGDVHSSGFAWSRGIPRHVRRRTSAQRAERVALDGAVWAFPLRTWRNVGELDERLFLYYEEVDWHTRARQRGYRVVCASRAYAYQSTSAAPTKAYYMARNGLWFRWRYSGRRWATWFVAFQIALAPARAIRCALAVIAGRRDSVARWERMRMIYRGLWDGSRRMHGPVSPPR